MIEYVPKVRGRHKLEITANGLPVPGNLYPVFVKISPTQLGKPVKVISGVKQPVAIAINSAGEVLVAEQHGDVVIIDKSGKKLHSIAKPQHHFKGLYGIAVDKDDAIYLLDKGNGKLFKFDQNHELVKVVTGEGQGLGQFYPWGITFCGDQVIVGSRCPPYLYIFHTNLELDRKIDLKRVGVSDIIGIAGDEHMNLYICELSNNSVHVLSLKGQGELLNSFQLDYPHSIHVSGGLVYVSSWRIHKIFVFTIQGKLVASFGHQGRKEGQFVLPSGLVIDTNGYLFVCDSSNDRLQLF